MSENVETSTGLVQLGEVAEVVMGQSPAGSDCNRDGVGVPLLNGPTEFGFRSPTPAQWTAAPTKFAEPSDLLFCVRGSTTGRMNIADQQYCIGRGLAAIRGRSQADTRFLHHALVAGLDELLALTTGTVFPNISGADLRGFRIPWPSAAERQRLSEVLGALDDRIESAARLEAVLAEAVLAEYGLALVDRESEESISLVDAVSLINGGAYTKGADGVGRMVIRIKELNSGPSETTVYSSITVPDNKTAHPGDVLFAWSGSLGVWRWYRDEAIVNQHIFKVLPKKHPVWLGWIHILDELERFQDIAAGKATTMGHITKDHLERTMVPTFSPEELQALSARVDPLWDAQLQAGRELHALQAVRAQLLPALVSGELRVAAAEELVEAST